MSLSEDDLGLLCAGFTAILGFNVVPPEKPVEREVQSGVQSSTGDLVGQQSVQESAKGAKAPPPPRRPKIGVHELFQATYKPFVPPLVHPQSAPMLESAHDYLDVNVKVINGATTTIRAQKGHTVKDIKEAIEKKLVIPVQAQQLTSFGQPMSDAHPIHMYMPPQPAGHSKVFCILGGDEPYELDSSEFDPPYNYDFTNEKDDGKEYTRGGKAYHRPYGWKRFAVKVLNDDRYGGDNTWLGEAGLRTEECKGEWPVSYHGTGRGGRDAVNSIIDTGYNIGPGALYGAGIYTSPIIKWYDDKNNRYTAKFYYKGEEWMVLLQNRVNPDPKHLEIQEKTWAGVPFWVSPLQDVENGVFDVRPYGVLFKKCC